MHYILSVTLKVSMFRANQYSPCAYIQHQTVFLVVVGNANRYNKQRQSNRVNEQSISLQMSMAQLKLGNEVKIDLFVFPQNQCDKFWRNSPLRLFFDVLFSILQNCEPTLVNCLCCWAFIHCCKGPNFERIIQPSGRTAQNSY